MDTPAPAATVGAHDAKTRLSELLDRVEQGEEIVITRHGRPIARLSRIAPGHDVAAALAAVEGLLAIREAIRQHSGPMTMAEILALRDEGRKY